MAISQTADLAGLAQRLCGPNSSLQTPIPGLTLYSYSDLQRQLCSLSGPSLGVVLQGSKTVNCGTSTLHYGEGDYLLISLDLPLTSYPKVASAERPYVGMSLELAPLEVLEVLSETSSEDDVEQHQPPGMIVSKLSPPLAAAVERLIRLLETPKHCKVLAPLIKKEITYHLLQGPQAKALLRLTVGVSGSPVVRAVEWLRNNYAEQLRIEQLAQSLHISNSSLHHQFKAVTSMTPLQYQKSIRLSEARRMLLETSKTAASVGFEVGYNSASQFSREYKRMFGLAPNQERTSDLNFAFTP